MRTLLICPPFFTLISILNTTTSSDTKRNKRLRLNSPAALGPSPTPPLPRSSLGPGAGTGPPAHAHSNASSTGPVVIGKNASARSRQHQNVEKLEPGRKVAFHQPQRRDPDTGEMSESQWILAVVKRFIPPNKYVLWSWGVAI